MFVSVKGGAVERTAAPRSGLRRIDLGAAVIGIPVAVAVVTILGLLAFVLWMSFARTEAGIATGGYSLDNYKSLWLDPTFARATINTAIFMLGSVTVAAVFGLPLAWLGERTDLPGRTLIPVVLVLKLLIPGFFTAMGWLFFLHPRIGMGNQLLMNWFDLSEAPLPITTMAGMIWVEGISLAPLFYIMSAGSFRAMDPSLEEAARASGASGFETMRRVVIPLLAPAILAAAIFTATTALGSFDIPAIIGLSSKILTFSTLIYVKVSAVESMPDYGTPAAFGTIVTVLAVLVSIFYLKVLRRARRYQVVTGKGYRPRIVKLGKYAIPAGAFFLFYVALALLIPLAVLVWSALLPVYQEPSLRAFRSLSLASFSALPWGLLQRGIVNSILVSLGAPTIALIMSVAISWCVLRSKMRGRRHLDAIAFVPHAVPGIIFALGAVLGALFLLPAWVPLYGSVTVLVLVYSIGWITFGTRVVNSSLIQIHSDLEDASYASGASRLDTLRLIYLPLLWPALVGAWIYLALLAFRELTRAIILVTGDNLTLPVVVWSLWNTGAMNLASATILVMLALFSPLVFLYFYFAKRP